VASSIIPTPKTIFKEIKKLPGGHFLTYRRGETHLEPYWKTGFLNPSTEKESILIQDLKTHFTDAVSVCLDVDEDSNHIGTFLSGGVDSSTLTGVLTKLVKHPVKSFSIGFDEERFNEINYARIAARAFGAEHYEYFVTPADTYDAISIVLSAIDEPYANASAIPAYFCAKMAKEHGVDVLYAGDGGDELFAGNERYATQRLFDYYQRIPPAVRNVLVEPLVLSLADALKLDFLIKGGRYIHRANLPYYERISSYDFFNIVPLTEFIGENLLVDISRNYNPYEIVDDYYHQAPANNNLDRHLFIDWKLTLTDNDLIKVTRMTEAAEVTVRFPFLDSKLVEFSTKVPAYIKMRGRKLRSFFKNAYSDLLPLEIRKKKKHGFGLPISFWLRTDKRLNNLMHDLVLSPQSLQRGYFKEKALEQLIEVHKTDDTSFYGTVLWNLMILELWQRNYLKKKAFVSKEHENNSRHKDVNV
jgi:asparagine synthase (glutamine-hydrolysing)